MTPRFVLPVALALCLVLTVSPCRGAETQLHVKGSDTIGGALGPALGKAYEAANPAVEVTWDSLGSGTAFVGLFDGSADLGAASRSVRENELAEAKRLGLELKEYVLGYDGIAVLVHPSNGVLALSFDQLSSIFSGRVSNWKAFGGPDLAIRRISRPEYSGTHGFFKEKVLRGGDKTSELEFAPDTEFLEHSEEIVARVAAEPGAISYLGMGWIRPGVRAVPVVSGRGEAVLPSPETVRRGTYPIYRPLLLYSRGEPQGEVRRFLSFLLAGDGQRLVAQYDFTPSDVPSTVSRSAVPRAGGGGDLEVLRVRFPSGGARLDAAARSVLDVLVEKLAGGGWSAEIVGHGDSEGSSVATERVALARARAVSEYLDRRGVGESVRRVEGHAAAEPVATNETVEGRALNRRVDTRLLPAS